MTKAGKVAIVGWVILLVLVDWWIWRNRVDDASGDLPVYTAITLTQHDGSTDAPVLLALDGLVYDVSAGRVDFYNPGESYHYLVGKDASSWLHIYGAGLIKEKYPVVGVYQP